MKRDIDGDPELCLWGKFPGYVLWQQTPPGGVNALFSKLAAKISMVFEGKKIYIISLHSVSMG
jgi:hypothetical protein